MNIMIFPVFRNMVFFFRKSFRYCSLLYLFFAIRFLFSLVNSYFELICLKAGKLRSTIKSANEENKYLCTQFFLFGLILTKKVPISIDC